MIIGQFHSVLNKTVWKFCISNYMVFLSLNISFISTNTAGPDKIQNSVVSDLKIKKIFKQNLYGYILVEK